MEKKFDKHMHDVQSHKTPGMPKFFIVRPMIEIEKISAKNEQEYQFGVGLLVYLMKQSCPDLANTTRELSKANDRMNFAAYKEPLHVIEEPLLVIKYILETKNLGLKIEHTRNFNDPWEIICFSDSNYTGDQIIKT